jgi:LytS/YehU family sensor histidine kinase
LSKMMRYLLYDSGQGKTTLRKEIEFLNSYIDLMKLRISDEIDLKISFLNNPPELVVPPLLFITFVENAFKYGISYKGKSYIYIVIEIINNEIHFNIRNSKSTIIHEPIESNGIGIKNTRNRLELLYNSEYKLNIYDKENEYEVDLFIPASYV